MYPNGPTLYSLALPQKILISIFIFCHFYFHCYTLKSYISKTTALAQPISFGSFKSVLSSQPDKSDFNSKTSSSHTNGSVLLQPPNYKACRSLKVTIAPATLCKGGPGNLKK